MKAALLAFLLLGGAQADGAYDLYAQGRYQDAMRVGAGLGNGAGLATAARAALADAMMRPQPCLECLERAEGYARRAIAADAALADGHVWLATALGYQARIIGLVRAKLADDPAQAKTELDAALKDDPDNAYALAALGGWNIEIVRAGGARLGKWLYGAEEAAGLSLFDRAVKAAPGKVAVHYQIALSLAGFAPEKYRARIESELEAAVHAVPATAYDKFIQSRAAELLAPVKKNDLAALDEKIRTYQGYP